jgi:H+/Cl- antiporter ClcA
VSTPPPAAQIEGATYLRLIALGAAIGIPAAFLAAVFLAFVHDLQHWLWHDLPSALGHATPPWYLVVVLPVVGACVVIVARTFLPGDGGHRPLDGIGGKPIPPAFAPSVALAAIGTLGFGAVLGPEAPLIALGSAVGLSVTWFVKLGQRENAVLSTAGSFSAISALFGGPIVGGILMTEAGVGLGTMLLPALVPGFVAAAIGYVIFLGFGSWGGLGTPGLTVPDLPAYQGTHLIDLLLAVAVGLVTAVSVALIRRLATNVAGPGEQRLGMGVLLLAGGLAVGVLAEVADLLGANSQDVLFSGQSSIPALLAEDSTKIVVILLVAKAIGYAVCLGCGFRGGPVFPALFIGTALATLTIVWFDVSPTLALAVGAAAGTAAMTRLLLTSMVLAALLVGTAGIDAIPAAVLAASTAWVTVTALDRRFPAPAAKAAEPAEAATAAP